MSVDVGRFGGSLPARLQESGETAGKRRSLSTAVQRVQWASHCVCALTVHRLCTDNELDQDEELDHNQARVDP